MIKTASHFSVKQGVRNMSSGDMTDFSAVNMTTVAGPAPTHCAWLQTVDKDRDFYVVCYVGILSTICLIGWVGNTLAFIVMRSDADTRGSIYMLQVLAVVDNVHLLTCFTHWISLAMFTYYPFAKEMLSWYPYLLPYMIVLDLAAHSTSVWILVLATIERHAAICRPIHTLNVAKHTRRMAIAVPILAIIGHIPRIFEYRLVPMCNSDKLVAYPHEFKNGLYYNIYKNVAYLLLLLLFPTLIFAVCNIQLLNAVRKAKRAIVATHRVVSDTRLTQMLVIVVVVFLLCHIPDYVIRTQAAIVYFIHATKNETFSEARMENVFPNERIVAISNLLLSLNSAVNCIIYCYVGRTFRKQLIHLFSCR